MGIRTLYNETHQGTKPESSSLGSGQVLSRPYAYDEGRIILKEMIDSLCSDLVVKNLVTDQITISVWL